MPTRKTKGGGYRYGKTGKTYYGDKFELGRITSLREDGAFVCHHEGETAAKTPYDCMHKLVNRYCIKETTLGGRKI